MCIACVCGCVCAKYVLCSRVRQADGPCAMAQMDSVTFGTEFEDFNYIFVCQNCGTNFSDKLRVCWGCKHTQFDRKLWARYCTRKCQKKHWRVVHAAQCTGVACWRAHRGWYNARLPKRLDKQLLHATERLVESLVDTFSASASSASGSASSASGAAPVAPPQGPNMELLRAAELLLEASKQLGELHRRQL